MKNNKLIKNMTCILRKGIAVFLTVTFFSQNLVLAQETLFPQNKYKLAAQTLFTGADTVDAFQRSVLLYINGIIAGNPDKVTLATIRSTLSFIQNQAIRKKFDEQDLPVIDDNSFEGEVKITFSNGQSLVFYNPYLSPVEKKEIDSVSKGTYIRSEKVLFDIAINRRLRKQLIVSEESKTVIADGREAGALEGGLMGKLYSTPEAEPEHLVMEEIVGVEEPGRKRGGLYLAFYPKAALAGVEIPADGRIYWNRRGQGNKKPDPLYTRDGRKAKVFIEERQESNGTVIISDHQHIHGYTNSNTRYIPRSFLNGKSFLGEIVNYHEDREAFYRNYPRELPKGITPHTMTRGCGKDVRLLVKEALRKKELRRNFSAKELCAVLTEKLPSKRLGNANSEFVLIEYNRRSGKNGIELLYGDQDREFGDILNESFYRTEIAWELYDIIEKHTPPGLKQLESWIKRNKQGRNKVDFPKYPTLPKGLERRMVKRYGSVDDARESLGFERLDKDSLKYWENICKVVFKADYGRSPTPKELTDFMDEKKNKKVNRNRRFPYKNDLSKAAGMSYTGICAMAKKYHTSIGHVRDRLGYPVHHRVEEKSLKVRDNAMREIYEKMYGISPDDKELAKFSEKQERAIETPSREDVGGVICSVRALREIYSRINGHEPDFDEFREFTQMDKRSQNQPAIRHEFFGVICSEDILGGIYKDLNAEDPDPAGLVEFIKLVARPVHPAEAAEIGEAIYAALNRDPHPGAKEFFREIGYEYPPDLLIEDNFFTALYEELYDKTPSPEELTEFKIWKPRKERLTKDRVSAKLLRAAWVKWGGLAVVAEMLGFIPGRRDGKASLSHWKNFCRELYKIIHETRPTDEELATFMTPIDKNKSLPAWEDWPAYMLYRISHFGGSYNIAKRLGLDYNYQDQTENKKWENMFRKLSDRYRDYGRNEMWEKLTPLMKAAMEEHHNGFRAVQDKFHTQIAKGWTKLYRKLLQRYKKSGPKAMWNNLTKKMNEETEKHPGNVKDDFLTTAELEDPAKLHEELSGRHETFGSEDMWIGIPYIIQTAIAVYHGGVKAARTAFETGVHEKWMSLYDKLSVPFNEFGFLKMWENLGDETWKAVEDYPGSVEGVKSEFLVTLAIDRPKTLVETAREIKQEGSDEALVLLTSAAEKIKATLRRNLHGEECRSFLAIVYGNGKAAKESEPAKKGSVAGSAAAGGKKVSRPRPDRSDEQADTIGTVFDMDEVGDSALEDEVASLNGHAPGVDDGEVTGEMFNVVDGDAEDEDPAEVTSTRANKRAFTGGGNLTKEDYKEWSTLCRLLDNMCRNVGYVKMWGILPAPVEDAMWEYHGGEEEVKRKYLQALASAVPNSFRDIANEIQGGKKEDIRILKEVYLEYRERLRARRSDVARDMDQLLGIKPERGTTVYVRTNRNDTQNGKVGGVSQAAKAASETPDKPDPGTVKPASSPDDEADEEFKRDAYEQLIHLMFYLVTEARTHNLGESGHADFLMAEQTLVKLLEIDGDRLGKRLRALEIKLLGKTAHEALIANFWRHRVGQLILASTVVDSLYAGEGFDHLKFDPKELDIESEPIIEWGNGGKKKPRDEGKGGLMGKLYSSPRAWPQDLVTQGIIGREDEAGTFLLFSYEDPESGLKKPLYTRNNNGWRAKVGIQERVEGTNISILAKNMHIFGFATRYRRYISRELRGDALAEFHEKRESYWAENPSRLPEGVSSHTMVRGCGKAVRDLVKDLGDDIKDYDADRLIDYLKEGLPDRRYNPHEFALIRHNAQRPRDGRPLKGVALIYGEQDRSRKFGPYVNETLKRARVCWKIYSHMKGAVPRDYKELSRWMRKKKRDEEKEPFPVSFVKDQTFRVEIQRAYGSIFNLRKSLHYSQGRRTKDNSLRRWPVMAGIILKACFIEEKNDHKPTDEELETFMDPVQNKELNKHRKFPKSATLESVSGVSLEMLEVATKRHYIKWGISKDGTDQEEGKELPEEVGWRAVKEYLGFEQRSKIGAASLSKRENVLSEIFTRMNGRIPDKDEIKEFGRKKEREIERPTREELGGVICSAMKLRAMYQEINGREPKLDELEEFTGNKGNTARRPAQDEILGIVLREEVLSRIYEDLNTKKPGDPELERFIEDLESPGGPPTGEEIGDAAKTALQIYYGGMRNFFEKLGFVVRPLSDLNTLLRAMYMDLHNGEVPSPAQLRRFKKDGIPDPLDRAVLSVRVRKAINGNWGGFSAFTAKLGGTAKVSLGKQSLAIWKNYCRELYKYLYKEKPTRGELKKFMQPTKKNKTFPTYKEFSDNGRDDLRVMAKVHHGGSFWVARKLGLDYDKADRRTPEKWENLYAKLLIRYEKYGTDRMLKRLTAQLRAAINKTHKGREAVKKRFWEEVKKNWAKLNKKLIKRYLARGFIYMWEDLTESMVDGIVKHPYSLLGVKKDFLKVLAEADPNEVVTLARNVLDRGAEDEMAILRDSAGDIKPIMMDLEQGDTFEVFCRIVGVALPGTVTGDQDLAESEPGPEETEARQAGSEADSDETDPAAEAIGVAFDPEDDGYDYEVALVAGNGLEPEDGPDFTREIILAPSTDQDDEDTDQADEEDELEEDAEEDKPGDKEKYKDWPPLCGLLDRTCERVGYVRMWGNLPEAARDAIDEYHDGQEEVERKFLGVLIRFMPNIFRDVANEINGKNTTRLAVILREVYLEQREWLLRRGRGDIVRDVDRVLGIEAGDNGNDTVAVVNRNNGPKTRYGADKTGRQAELRKPGGTAQHVKQGASPAAESVGTSKDGKYTEEKRRAYENLAYVAYVVVIESRSHVLSNGGDADFETAQDLLSLLLRVDKDNLLRYFYDLYQRSIMNTGMFDELLARFWRTRIGKEIIQVTETQPFHAGSSFDRTRFDERDFKGELLNDRGASDDALARFLHTPIKAKTPAANTPEAGGLMGKLYSSPRAWPQDLVKDHIIGREDKLGTRKMWFVFSYENAQEEEKPLYTRDGTPAKIRLIDRVPGTNISVLARNKDVIAFSSPKNRYVNQRYLDDDLVRFHEKRETYWEKHRKQLPDGVNSHTMARGCGKDVRRLVKDLGFSAREYDAEELITYLEDKLPEERHNPYEFALIRHNAATGGNGKPLKGEALIWGDQDHSERFGLFTNESFYRIRACREIFGHMKNGRAPTTYAQVLRWKERKKTEKDSRQLTRVLALHPDLVADIQKGFGSKYDFRRTFHFPGAKRWGNSSLKHFSTLGRIIWKACLIEAGIDREPTDEELEIFMDPARNKQMTKGRKLPKQVTLEKASGLSMDRIYDAVEKYKGTWGLTVEEKKNEGATSGETTGAGEKDAGEEDGETSWRAIREYFGFERKTRAKEKSLQDRNNVLSEVFTLMNGRVPSESEVKEFGKKKNRYVKRPTREELGGVICSVKKLSGIYREINGEEPNLEELQAFTGNEAASRSRPYQDEIFGIVCSEEALSRIYEERHGVKPEKKELEAFIDDVERERGPPSHNELGGAITSSVKRYHRGHSVFFEELGFIMTPLTDWDTFLKFLYFDVHGRLPSDKELSGFKKGVGVPETLDPKKLSREVLRAGNSYFGGLGRIAKKLKSSTERRTTVLSLAIWKNYCYALFEFIHGEKPNQKELKAFMKPNRKDIRFPHNKEFVDTKHSDLNYFTVQHGGSFWVARKLGLIFDGPDKRKINVWTNIYRKLLYRYDKYGRDGMIGDMGEKTKRSIREHYGDLVMVENKFWGEVERNWHSLYKKLAKRYEKTNFVSMWDGLTEKMIDQVASHIHCLEGTKRDFVKVLARTSPDQVATVVRDVYDIGHVDDLDLLKGIAGEIKTILIGSEHENTFREFCERLDLNPGEVEAVEVVEQVKLVVEETGDVRGTTHVETVARPDRIVGTSVGGRGRRHLSADDHLDGLVLEDDEVGDDGAEDEAVLLAGNGVTFPDDDGGYAGATGADREEARDDEPAESTEEVKDEPGTSAKKAKVKDKEEYRDWPRLCGDLDKAYGKVGLVRMWGSLSEEASEAIEEYHDGLEAVQKKFLEVLLKYMPNLFRDAVNEINGKSTERLAVIIREVYSENREWLLTRARSDIVRDVDNMLGIKMSLHTEKLAHGVVNGQDTQNGVNGKRLQNRPSVAPKAAKAAEQKDASPVAETEEVKAPETGDNGQYEEMKMEAYAKLKLLVYYVVTGATSNDLSGGTGDANAAAKIFRLLLAIDRETLVARLQALGTNSLGDSVSEALLAGFWRHKVGQAIIAGANMDPLPLHAGAGFDHLRFDPKEFDLEGEKDKAERELLDLRLKEQREKRRRAPDMAKKVSTEESVNVPLTPDHIRSIHPEVTAHDDEEAGELLSALKRNFENEYHHYSDFSVAPWLPRFRAGLSKTFLWGRLNITAFVSGHDKNQAIFSISHGDDIIGHGTLGYLAAKERVAFRYAIHDGKDALVKRDFSGQRYGKEALILIMAMCENSGIFEDVPINEFVFTSTRNDYNKPRMHYLWNMLYKAGFNMETTYNPAFSMTNETPVAPPTESVAGRGYFEPIPEEASAPEDIWEETFPSFPLVPDDIYNMKLRPVTNTGRSSGEKFFRFKSALDNEYYNDNTAQMQKLILECDSSISRTFSYGGLDITYFMNKISRTLPLFSIEKNNTVIGHGTLVYSPPDEEVLLRFSIHNGEKAREKMNYRGQGYGKKALPLIMAMCANGKIFGGEARIFCLNTLPAQHGEPGVRSMIRLVESAGFTEGGMGLIEFFMDTERQAEAVRMSGPNMSLVKASVGAARRMDDVSPGDTTNPLIESHIRRGKAIELSKTGSDWTVKRINMDEPSLRDRGLEEESREKDIFERIEQAKDRTILEQIVTKPSFRNMDQEALIDIVQHVSLSLILGEVIIGVNDRGESVFGHARTGLSKDKHHLDPTVWIGEVLFNRLSDIELAQFLLEEAKHILNPEAEDGIIDGADDAGMVVEHEQDFIDSINIDPPAPGELAMLLGQKKEVEEHEYPLFNTAQDIEQNAEKIAPHLVNTLMLWAEQPDKKDRDLVLLLDMPAIHAEKIKETIIKAIRYMKVGDRELRQKLNNLTIADRRKIGVVKRRLALGVRLRAEDVIVLTDKTNLETFTQKEFDGAFITAINMPVRMDGFREDSYYYPYLEAAFFAVLRAVSYEPGKLNAYKERIWKWYKLIPNVDKLGQKELLRLCLDGADLDTPAKVVILQLIVPDATRINPGEIEELYEREMEFIISA